RVPFANEWEFAARAGSSFAFEFGNSDAELERYAHCGLRNGEKQPPGRLEPNAWGLYDIHGNVSEWVQWTDDIAKEIESTTDRRVDLQAGEGGFRYRVDGREEFALKMGSSFSNARSKCGFGKPTDIKTTYRPPDVGLRLARSPLPPPAEGPEFSSSQQEETPKIQPADR
ncbi:MAG: SUMF1/EgtB/PvdO family nonheme iron enzyme, partial [Acidobacteriota bacterium]